MNFLFIGSLIVLGLVAASGFVGTKIPQTKVGIDFIKPFSGWIGLVSMVLGMYWLIKTIEHIGTLFSFAPFRTTVFIVSIFISIFLGYVMIQGLIKQFSGKNESVDNFVKKMGTNLLPIQEKLGLAAIGMGLVNLLLVIT